MASFDEAIHPHEFDAPDVNAVPFTSLFVPQFKHSHWKYDFPFFPTTRSPTFHFPIVCPVKSNRLLFAVSAVLIDLSIFF